MLIMHNNKYLPLTGLLTLLQSTIHNTACISFIRQNISISMVWNDVSTSRQWLSVNTCAD